MIDQELESPRTRPRVWPVFAAFVAVIVGVLVGYGVLAVVLVAMRDGSMPSPSSFDASVAEVLLTPGALIGSVALSVGLLVATSLVGGALSAQPLRRRLGLGNVSVRWLAWPVSVLGLLAVGHTLEVTAALLGFRDGSSSLDILAGAIASMPGSAFFAFVFAGSFGAGFGEELFFRGFAQTRLAERWGVPVGVVVASAGFALLHFDPLHSTLAFFLGLYLGWLAAASGSIVLPIAAHIGNNLVAFIAMRAAGDAPGPSVIQLIIGAGIAAACVMWLSRVLARAPGGASSAPL